ncbi:MAG: aldehyde dehydrogenase family protein [Actinobacteria bacterium]|nr:aldehyde dehydrogenase family protein [Actinomycetota bacterium]
MSTEPPTDGTGAEPNAGGAMGVEPADAAATDAGTPEVGEALRDRALAALRACGVEPGDVGATSLPVTSPIDGEELLELEGASAADALAAAVLAAEAFGVWRAVAPEDRAAAVSAIARELDRCAPALAELIAIETGKPFAAAIAEVEAAVSACTRAADVATNVAALPTASAADPGAAEPPLPLPAGPMPGVGSSPTEAVPAPGSVPSSSAATAVGAGSSPGPPPTGRFEARRPLGPVAVLGSVGTPLLEWAAAAPFALACGCPVVWRPAAPLVATAVEALVDAALASATGRDAATSAPGLDPGDSALASGAHADPAGRQLTSGATPQPAPTAGPDAAARPLGSAAPAGLHSVVPGEADAAEALAEAPGVELVVRPRAPGANVAIVAPGADLDATAATLAEAALAGAGRATASLHLVFAHASIAAALEQRLVTAFAAATIGDPLAPETALGPLRDLDAYRDHLDAIQTAEAEGGELLVGGEARDLDAFPAAYYVEPALIRAPALLAHVSTPVLFLATYTEMEEALTRRDTVARRWSALLGGTAEEAARFLAAPGSDRDFIAVGTCPSAADLEAPDADAWRTFTRLVSGRVGRGS